jgi:ketosteroid isomerase-like protein
MSASAQQNRDIVRRYARMFDTGDLDEADELFAPDFISFGTSTLRSWIAKGGRDFPNRS